jgi:electron transfer flavoprotein alpha subunit
MAGDILVFGEQREGKLHPAALQAMHAAKTLASATGGRVLACVVGQNVRDAAQTLAKHGAAKVLVADDAALALYRPQPYTTAVKACVEKAGASVVLMPTTFMTRDLAPRLAVRTGGALATDCTEVSAGGGALKVRRPVYNGKAFCDLTLAGDRPAIITIRPNTYPAADASGSAGEIEAVPVSIGGDEQKLVCKEVVRTSSGVKDVSEADISVSGGRSLKSEENFKIIYELAAALDGAVGASRAACDAGYQPHSRQVGLTGKTVTPKLYIACGIDGAIQHLAGMRGSKVIVAINTKKEAPIYSVATYGCVADLFEVVPKLTEEVRKL